jgi:exodeoxyribonuclease V alpha subunit
MSASLAELMDAGCLPPLSYYFARFVADGCDQAEDSVLGRSAALVSMRNMHGDVCADLARFAGQPLFDSAGQQAPDRPRAPDLEDWLTELGSAPWVGGPNADTPLILEGTRLYLGKYWRYEQQVAVSLRGRMSAIGDLDADRLSRSLNRLFPPPGSGGPDWQRVASAIAASRRFAVISGGPGTGKTTTVVRVLTLLLEQNPSLRIALSAPTGKAAARLTEAVRGGKTRVSADPVILERIPEEAATLHRLLGARPNLEFRHHAENPLLLDCLVVDEASMVDLPLMARLLAALPADARLILLGDRDQLASVEAGSVLGDITGQGQALPYGPEQIRWLERLGAAPAGSLPAGACVMPAAESVALLRVSHRFGASSGIGALSVAVNTGRGENALELLADPALDDIHWRDSPSDAPDAACLEQAVDEFRAYLRLDDVVQALARFEQFRILTALRRGPFGAQTLNERITTRLQQKGLIAGGAEFHGKPVMITSNDYEVGLFNGDIGLLWRRDSGAPLRAWFPATDGQPRSVPVRQLPAHASAFALTVHKSQGSEFDRVMLVLPHDPSPVVTRELIYTGITRARQRALIHGSRESFKQACRSRVERSSGLATKLGWPQDSRN